MWRKLAACDGKPETQAGSTGHGTFSVTTGLFACRSAAGVEESPRNFGALRIFRDLCDLIRPEYVPLDGRFHGSENRAAQLREEILRLTRGREARLITVRRGLACGIGVNSRVLRFSSSSRRRDLPAFHGQTARLVGMAEHGLSSILVDDCGQD